MLQRSATIVASPALTLSAGRCKINAYRHASMAIRSPPKWPLTKTKYATHKIPFAYAIDPPGYADAAMHRKAFCVAPRKTLFRGSVPAFPGARWCCSPPIAACLIAGWSLPALFVFGAACFKGHTINCPSDLLMLPGFHTAPESSPAEQVKNDTTLMDLVQLAAPAREFMAQEYRHGRIPVWNPYIFCGAPFAVANKFSPFELLYVAFPVPQILIWMQLAQSVVMGLGTYLFLNRSLAVSRPAAVLGSVLSPYLGFLTVWQGFTGLTASVCCLPWLLNFTDAAFRRPFSNAVSCLALSTTFAVVCGATDITALVLVTAGLRMLWNCAASCNLKRIRAGAISTTAGWILGLSIASPHLLPLLEYSGSGARMAQRSAGAEERPPIGMEALWQLVVPEFFGGSRALVPYLGPAGNMAESTGGAYLGLATLLCITLCMPLFKGWRRELLFWIPVALLGLSWQIDFPGVVSLQRLWPLNMLSWNRWVFITAFTQLVLAALAFDAFTQKPIGRIYARGAAVAVLSVAVIMLVVHQVPSADFFEPLQIEMARRVGLGASAEHIRNMLVEWRRGWGIAAGACFALAGSFLLESTSNGRKTIAAGTLVLALCLEPVMFARLQRRVAPAHTYFPRVPLFAALRSLPPGRILGVQCLPPNLAQPWHLRDVRGYDAVDPKNITRLLRLAACRDDNSPEYARTQWLVPALAPTTDGSMRLSPILDMLNVRYVVLPSKPLFSDVPIMEGDGFWILENKRVMPRSFVPRNVVPASDEHALEMMSSLDFDPAAVAYTELGTVRVSHSEGNVTIDADNAVYLRMTAAMHRPGVVVISDSWHPDWTVRVDGIAATPLRLNTAVRGVHVAAGRHEIVWEYRPHTMLRTAWLAGISLLACLAWLMIDFIRKPRGDRPTLG